MTFSADAHDWGLPARVVFQPLVDLHEWKVVGFEALARFERLSSPLEAFARAERDGRREELELKLIELAIDAAPQLPEDLFITLNASGTTMLEPRLADMLDAMVRPWGLELFEAATPVDLTVVRARVTALGGQLLVDDAGAANADVPRIMQLRPDVVKIDRALFWKVTSDAAARAELEELLEAARDIGARVLVEGIAEAEHVDLARSLGADLGQGFHIGMPTPAEEVPAMLRSLHRGIGVDAPGL